MKLNDIVGLNLEKVERLEKEVSTFALHFEGGRILFIETSELQDESGSSFLPGDLDNKGVREIEYEDGEIVVTFVDDVVAYISTDTVTDREGLEVELEDPEAGADDTDIDPAEQETPEEGFVPDVDDTGADTTGIPDEIEDTDIDQETPEEGFVPDVDDTGADTTGIPDEVED